MNTRKKEKNLDSSQKLQVHAQETHFLQGQWQAEGYLIEITVNTIL